MSATRAIRVRAPPRRSAPRSRCRAAGEDPFAVQSIALGGRVVQADLVDLDGDARGELLCIRIEGMPPDERARSTSSTSRPDRTFPAAADWSAPLPSGAAAYDLAELDAQPGAELILLRRDRLTLLSLVGPRARVPRPRRRARADDRGGRPTSAASTGCRSRATASPASRGCSCPASARPRCSRPRARCSARLDVGARANYYLPQAARPARLRERGADLLRSPAPVGGRRRRRWPRRHREREPPRAARVRSRTRTGGFPERATRRIALGLLDARGPRAQHGRRCASTRVDLDGDRRARSPDLARGRKRVLRVDRRPSRST